MNYIKRRKYFISITSLNSITLSKLNTNEKLFTTNSTILYNQFVGTK